MKRKSRQEKERTEFIDTMVLLNKHRAIRQYKTSCGEYGLLIQDKSKLALTKRIMEKEKRGWECAAPIAYNDGFYHVRMVYDRKSLKEQV
ncbi:hypothetical protein ACTHP3_21000 [Shouchella rhizosphaerae]|uniref:hypothetical protein n=1 Tax=Shouchella rhizosphaerae TaxID=866786 RepID=UPI003F802980